MASSGKQNTSRLGKRRRIFPFHRESRRCARIFVRQVDDGVNRRASPRTMAVSADMISTSQGCPFAKVSPVLPEYLLRKTGVVIIVYAFNLHDSRAYFAQEEISTLFKERCASAVSLQIAGSGGAGEGQNVADVCHSVIYISRRSKPRPKPGAPRRRSAAINIPLISVDIHAQLLHAGGKLLRIVFRAGSRR